MEAKVERLPTETTRVGDAGRIEKNVRTITFTPTVSHLRVSVGGKTFLSKSHSNRPNGMLRGQEGESLAMAIQRITSPNPRFFLQGSFPTKLTLFAEDLPELEFTANGIELIKE